MIVSQISRAVKNSSRSTVYHPAGEGGPWCWCSPRLPPGALLAAKPRCTSLRPVLKQRVEPSLFARPPNPPAARLTFCRLALACPLLTATTIVAAPWCSTSLPASLPRRCVASAVRHASLITPVSSALDEARKSTLRSAVAPTFGVASGAGAGCGEQRARRQRRGGHGAASGR